MTDELRHRTVLLEEAVAALNITPDGTYADATFGRGGHSRAILAALGAHGRVIAIDRDPSAVRIGLGLNDPRFSIVHARFGELQSVLNNLGITDLNGVLLDLGVSSPQLEDPARGFSFRLQGPLDMRMDPSRGQTARDWINTAAEGEIREVVKTYGEERFARSIARAVVAARIRAPIETTRELAEIVARAVRTRDPHQDPATRTFQAIRIFVNRELDELSLALPQAMNALVLGGRLVVISFHSLEDRIVKRFMRDQASAPAFPRKLPLRAAEIGSPRLRVIGRPVRPAPAEVGANLRARSAVMRVAEALEARP